MPNIYDLFDCGTANSGSVNIDQGYVDAILHGVDVTARMAKLSLFVIDMERKNVVYKSPHMLFAHQIAQDYHKHECEIMYWSAMSDATLQEMLTLRKKFLTFTKGKLADFVLYMDYPIIIKNKEIYIHQECKTLLATSDGTVKLCATGIKCSVRSELKCTMFNKDGAAWYYDFATKSFLLTSPSSLLSENEMEILRMAEMGYCKEDIATQKSITLNTVKSHYRNIFKKLGVNNISSAITCMYNRQTFK